MSRSGYTDDGENFGLWRGSVERAIRGVRGQAFLRELIAALNALPTKELASGSFTRGGEVCALGSVALKRGIDTSGFEIAADAEWYEECDREAIGKAFNIAPSMAAEIMYENDEGGSWRHSDTPRERWERMRAWAVENLHSVTDGGAEQ